MIGLQLNISICTHFHFRKNISSEKIKFYYSQKQFFLPRAFSTESKYSVICVDFINSSLRFTRISDGTNVGEQDVSFRSGDDAAIRVLRRELRRHQKHVNQNVQTFEIGGLRSNDLKHSLESKIHRVTCIFIVFSYIFGSNGVWIAKFKKIDLKNFLEFSNADL